MKQTKTKQQKENKRENINIRCMVDKIMHRDQESGYTIFKATLKDYDSSFVPTSSVTVTGNFASIFEDDDYTAVGAWVENRTFGWQLQVRDQKRVLPTSEKSAIRFLQKFVKGVGLKTAKAIVQAYGSETFDKIRDIKNLEAVEGIGAKKAKLIHDEFMKNDKFDKVALFVLNAGLGYKAAIRIYTEFGEYAITKIKENPYNLVNVEGIGFKSADKIANSLGYKYNDPKRIEASVVELIKVTGKQEGHLFLYQQDILNGLSDFLVRNAEIEMTKGITESEILASLKALQDKKTIKIHSENGVDYVYVNGMFYLEQKIVKELKKLLTKSVEMIATEEEIDKACDEYETETGFKLAKGQRQAIKTSLTSNVSILTGGPGTGKTQTINAMLKVFKKLKKKGTFTLSAPTGKAARRMTELTGFESQTVHRLIGLSSENSEIQAVETDMLIIDESSMVDAYLFVKILQAVESGTRLMLVGDVDQLPSVGEGLILKDLIDSGVVPTSRLTEIFRQALNSQIVTNAHAIISKNVDALSFDNSKGDFYFLETPHKMDVQKRIIGSMDKMIKNGRFTLDQIQVLSPSRISEIGVDDLNKVIQNKFNPYNAKKNEMRVDAMTCFREGDRVMQTVNNYDLEVVNGEVGKIESIYELEGEKVVVVEYDDREVEYMGVDLEELKHSFAMTIHKSQGSEIPLVIIPVHSSQSFMANRNLYYTALTRAKVCAIFVGEKETLNEIITSQKEIKRNSRIKELLAN